VFALDVTVWEGVSIDRAERVLMEEMRRSDDPSEQA